MTKKPWESKTAWINFLTAVGVLFYPPASEVITSNPEIVTCVFAGVNILLRLITKSGVTLK